MKSRKLLTGGAAIALAFIAIPAAVQADTATVPIEVQGYVNEGSPVDPHNGDTTALHVDVTGGKETAQSYFRLNLNYLPEGARLDSLNITFKPTAPATAGAPDPNNVANTSAILEYCLLAEPIPAGMSPSHAPLKNACSTASKVGQWKDGNQVVDLRPLAAKWLAGPNYGAVVIPVPSGSSTENYRVGFDRSQTSVQASYTPAAAIQSQPAPAQQAQPAPQQGTNPPAPATGPGTASTSGIPVGPGLVLPTDPGQATPAAPATAPAAPIIHHQAQPAAPAAPTGGANQPGPVGWPLLLLVAAAAGAVGLLAYPVGQALSGGPGSAGVGLLQQLRLHPRLFAVTGVLGVYSATFGSYTLAHPGSGPAAGASRQALATPSADASGTPGADASPSPSTGTSPLPGVTPGVGGITAGPAAGQQGTTQTINGTTVFIPSGGGPPSANLYPASEDHVGMTDSEIRLCGHAALTYANAFQTTKDDFNVFWSNVNDHGGIYGRKVTMDYQNDNYDPQTAVQAAETCKNEGIFLLLGGIGFDQIPNVRMWAEQNRMMYIHHIATEQGAANLKYSFAPLPTVEEAGRMFAEVYLRQFKGKKVGILHRGSVYWDPGYNAFRSALRDAGQESNIVYQAPVKQNQGSYAQELQGARAAGSEVMWSWENALDTPEMIKQAKAQQWSPDWMVFPFNVELTALGTSQDAVSPPITGVAAWPAYTKGEYGGPFASYASDIHEFEAEYHYYRPKTDLGGAGGDLLFLNWVAQKELYQQFLDCGRDCSRNKMAGMLLTGYKKTVSPNCPEDWSRVSHRGGFALDIFQTYIASSGKSAWRPIARCVERY